MASKHASRAVRGSLRQLSTPRVQQRTFAAAVDASRPVLQKATAPAFVHQSRGMKTVDFAGDKEVVYGKTLKQLIMREYPLTRHEQSATTGRETSSWYLPLSITSAIIDFDD